MIGRDIPITGASVRARRRAQVASLAGALLMLVAALQAGADSYLEAIEIEAGKIGAVGSGADEGGSGGARADFERELQHRYRGSWLFYKKLPEQSQEEVFVEYREGASIDEVRKTIMNRFLHSR